MLCVTHSLLKTQRTLSDILYAPLHTAPVKVKGNTYKTLLPVMSAPTYVLYEKQSVVFPCLGTTGS